MAKMIPGSLLQSVELKLQECFKKAQRAFPSATLTFPTYDFDKTGTTAGTCSYRENHLSFNRVLLIENGEDFVNRTVVHELAHALTYQVYGLEGIKNFRTGRYEHHGSKWKNMMVTLGANPSRTHSYDVSNSARKTNHYMWKCECGAVAPVSRAKHNRMMTGSYHHKCGNGKRGKLEFLTLIERETKSGAIQIAKQMVSGEKVDVVEKKEKKQTPKARPKTQPKTRQKGRVSNTSRAREFATEFPSATSSDFRNWAESTLEVSPHGARALYSKMLSEGLLKKQ